MIRLGVIGMGVRATHVTSLLCSEDPEVRVSLVADPHGEASRQRMVEAKINVDSTAFVATSDELFARADELDALLIGTRCNLHAELATRWAARAGGGSPTSSATRR